tara:strand:+ start:940 stop:1437 length:498 start_codon:yes stop_codon:yes gene_type:complete
MSKIVSCILILVVAVGTSSFGCHCSDKLIVKKAIRKSDVVVLGQIIKKETLVVPYKVEGIEIVSLNYYKLSVQVSRLFKGKKVFDVIEIITGVGKGDCGFNFVLNQNYIIYLVQKEKYFYTGNEVTPFLYTDMCSRTCISNIGEINKIEESCSFKLWSPSTLRND